MGSAERDIHVHKRWRDARGGYDARSASPKISIAFDRETFDKLSALAEMRDVSFATIVREKIDAAMSMQHCPACGHAHRVKRQP